MLKRYLADEGGGTAIEYALLGMIIAVGLVASFTLVGDIVANMFGGNGSGAIGALEGAIDGR